MMSSLVVECDNSRPGLVPDTSLILEVKYDEVNDSKTNALALSMSDSEVLGVTPRDVPLPTGVCLLDQDSQSPEMPCKDGKCHEVRYTEDVATQKTPLPGLAAQSKTKAIPICGPVEEGRTLSQKDIPILTNIVDDMEIDPANVP